MVRVITQESIGEKIRNNISPLRSVVFLFLLIIGIGATFFLIQSQQDIRQRAAGTTTSEFGFNTHINTAGEPGYWENLDLNVFKKTVDDLKANNQQWIRLNIAPWESASSGSPTSINWNEENLQKYDEAINYAKEKGLKVYLATATPDFAKDFSESDYIATTKLYHKTLAARYKGKIDVWQAWNEADAHRYRDYSPLSFGEENTGNYASQFKIMLAAAREAIKNEDPNVQFTTNVGRYPVNEDMFTNMQTFLDVIQPELDIIALDLYPDGNFQGLFSKVNSIKNAYGKQVIIAETGLPTGDGRFTEGQQGEFVSGVINELKLADPIAIIVYQYSDTLPNSNPTESSFGIVKVDGSKKTSYDKIISSMTPQIPEDTGLLRVETDPPVPAIISAVSLETGEQIISKEWGINWEPLPVGNYRISFAYTNPINGQPPKLPNDIIATVYKNQTTTIKANLSTSKYTLAPEPSLPPPPTQAPTLTPTPSVASTTGLLRVETRPATEATIKVLSSRLKVVSQTKWSVDWKALPPGRYYLTFSYPRKIGVKAPGTTTFSITTGKTTEIIADFKTGRTHITYK